MRGRGEWPNPGAKGIFKMNSEGGGILAISAKVARFGYGKRGFLAKNGGDNGVPTDKSLLFIPFGAAETHKSHGRGGGEGEGKGQ